MAEVYSISVGRERIAEGISGHLDRTSRTPNGKQTEVLIPVGGYPIPASTMAWGRRYFVNKEGKRVYEKGGADIEVTDLDYRGAVEFLAWGHKDGMQIMVQYLPTCGSLDKLYQERRLNLKPTDEDITIDLQQGENRFNYDSEETKIEFLKISSLNKNSVSKDPKIRTAIFWELKPGDFKQKDVAAIRNIGNAIGLVNTIETKPGNLRSLFSILGGTKAMPEVQDAKNETQIYPALMKFAGYKGAEFLQKTEEYKKEMSDLISKIEAFSLADFTLVGEFGVMQNEKKVVILKGVDGLKNGEDIKDWMMENFTHPDSFEATTKLREMAAKLK